MKEGLKFVTNPDTFANLITKSDIFVDKSLFIKEILDDSQHANLITRPPRWGKSLNMDMLKTFLEPDVDENGNFDFSKGNKNKKLFEGCTID